MFQDFDEDRYRALTEHSLDAVALIQSDGRVFYVSPSITRILGYTPAEFVDYEAFQIVHPDDRDEAISRFNELLKRPGSSQSAVNRVRHKDGSWKWIETVGTNQLEAPALKSIIANFRDITERKHAEDRAREVEEKFRFIVESATDFAIFTTDLEGRVDSWNSGANRILGYEEAEIIGQDCRVFFTPEDNSKAQPELEMHDALTEGSGSDERWHLRKDGSRFWGSGSMMPLRDDAGKTRGYLKIFRDMTRQKRDEESLKDADRRKDEFLATLAHELRNPLAAISNAAQLLSMPADQRNLEWSQGVIERQSKHLGRLLDDLLDVSRISQGKIRLQTERLDLNAIILKAIEVVRPLIERKKHRLNLLVSSGPLVVVGDATRIEQILVNLLSNAIKYTDEEGQIFLSTQRGNQATITVQDTGIGIPPEMHTRIFDLFVQVDPSIDRAEGGLGIGLTLARSLVEMHGGTIHVTSAGIGKGSEFTISLPLADEQVIPHRVADQKLEPPSQRPFQVLVVDDNQDTAIGLAKLLTFSGFNVSTAHDGHAAIQLARAESPNLVLLDIGLPGLNGYEIARQLREKGACKTSLIIAISGYGQEDDVRRSREAGFDHHLVKPVEYEALTKIIFQYIASVSASQNQPG